MGDNILRTLYRSVFNHWRNWPAKQSNSVRNAKDGLLRRSRSFKVIEIGINRKPVCDFLLAINSNWHPISCRFGVIAAYCSNLGHFVFLSHPFGGLGTMYDVHFRLIGKRVVDFLRADGQTDRILIDSVCIPCSAVKNWAVAECFAPSTPEGSDASRSHQSYWFCCR